MWPFTLVRGRWRKANDLAAVRVGSCEHDLERLRAFCNRQSAVGGRRRVLLSAFSNVWSSAPQSDALYEKLELMTTSPWSARVGPSATGNHWHGRAA